MKIGDFAAKYGLNITAVRYYVDKALLTPERKNNQYIFNKTCMEDMEKILKYKSFNFSLEEIELLFFLEKTSKFRDDTVVDIFSELLNHKLAELKNEEKNIHAVIERLESEIANFPKTHHDDHIPINGVPLTFIPYLYCSVCGLPLSLSSADIADNKILRGELTCSCGYGDEISDGVILCHGYTETTPFKAFKNIESVASITEDFGSEYRLLIDRTYMWIYHNLPEYTDRRNIMVGPFTYNFILKYCQNFGKETTFIVTDPSLRRIQKLREYMTGFDFQTVFLAGSPENLPLKKGCVDIYIDDFSATNCIFTYNESPYKHISPLLNRRGMSLGIFSDYFEAPKSLRNFKKDHPDFIPEKMSFPVIKNDLAINGMAFAESKILGKTSGKEKEFLRQEGNEKVSVMGYKAVKKRRI